MDRYATDGVKFLDTDIEVKDGRVDDGEDEHGREDEDEAENRLGDALAPRTLLTNRVLG